MSKKNPWKNLTEAKKEAIAKVFARAGFRFRAETVDAAEAFVAD